MKRGFISGIVISLVVAFMTLGYATVSNAQSGGSPSIWSGLRQGVAIATGNSQAQTATPPPAPVAFPTLPTPSAPSPAATPPSPVTYVALGDSVASGLGLPLVDNATTQDRRCGRSSQSYAYEVGRQLDKSVGLYACSGASSGDLYTRQWLSNFNPRIQIDQAFAQGKPELVTITIGANDTQWSQLIRRCYYGTCGTTTQTELSNWRLTRLQQRLHYALQQIQDRSHDAPPAVILTGYYNPVSQNCAALYPERISSQEITWVSNGVQSLNQTLRQVASQYSFASFAPVDFSGHDICSGASWVQGLTDQTPIHPTAEGQQAIASSVVAAYKTN
jgi:lysophospholipase L1-like esterase